MDVSVGSFGFTLKMNRTAFKFTSENIESFQQWNQLILLMPVKLATAFHSIKMTFNKRIGVGGGQLGLYMLDELGQTETIEDGLFMSGRGEINQRSCPVTLDDTSTGDKITLLPGRYAGKYGTIETKPVYSGQTVRELLIQNKGITYVTLLEKRLKGAKQEDEKETTSSFGLEYILMYYQGALSYYGVGELPLMYTPSVTRTTTESCLPCHLYLGYLSDHGFLLDVETGDFEAKYTEKKE